MRMHVTESEHLGNNTVLRVSGDNAQAVEAVALPPKSWERSNIWLFLVNGETLESCEWSMRCSLELALSRLAGIEHDLTREDPMGLINSHYGVVSCHIGTPRERELILALGRALGGEARAKIEAHEQRKSLVPA